MVGEEKSCDAKVCVSTEYKDHPAYGDLKGRYKEGDRARVRKKRDKIIYREFFEGDTSISGKNRKVKMAKRLNYAN